MVVHFMIKYENFSKMSINIFFLGLSKEFTKDSETFKLAMVNDPSVFEL